jgi:PAX-interacting protein 1
MKQNRAYRVVIRNLYYSIPVEEITKELRSQGHTVFNIINIRHRVHKHPLSMFYIDLEPQHNNKDIYNLQYLSNMKRMVEPPNKDRTIIQCTRCQLYGHSKSYCTRPYKWVKCGGNHITTDRQKSKDTPAKCALCSGGHTANYKGCTVYRDLINARRTQTARHPGRQNIAQHVPHAPNPQQVMQTNNTYSQALEGTNETTSDYNCIPSSSNSKKCSSD